MRANIFSPINLLDNEQMIVFLSETVFVCLNGFFFFFLGGGGGEVLQGNVRQTCTRDIQDKRKYKILHKE